MMLWWWCLFKWANQHVCHMMAHETHVLPADAAADGGISEECWGYVASLFSEFICIFDGFHKEMLWVISSNLSSFFSLSLVKHESIESSQVLRPGRPRPHLFLCVFSPASRTVTSSRPSAGARAHHEGQSDLLLESSFYNFYQPSCYPSYYSNLYNYQQYQVSRQHSTRPSSQINRNCLTVHNSRFLNRGSMATWNMRWNDWCWSLWYHKSLLRALLYKTGF